MVNQWGSIKGKLPHLQAGQTLTCHWGYRAPCGIGMSDLPGVIQPVSGWNGIWTEALFPTPMAYDFKYYNYHARFYSQKIGLTAFTKKKRKRKGKQNISSLNYYIGVPVVAQWVKNPTCLCKDEGWIPSIAQCIKDPVLPQAVEQVTAAAQHSVLPWLWLRQTAAAPNSPPSPWTSVCHRCGRKKKKKTKTKNYYTENG